MGYFLLGWQAVKTSQGRNMATEELSKEGTHPGTPRGGRMSAVLAVTGILVGLACVLAGLLSPARPGESEADVVARVDDRPIPGARLRQLADGLNRERAARGTPPLPRSEILDRLIEEELLVGRVVELGLPYTDKIARGYLINSLVSMITHDALNAEPPRETLEAYYRKNPAWFVPAVQVAAQLLFVADASEQGRRRAMDLAAQWRQTPPGQTVSADPVPLPVPGSLVPVHKLADYVGAGTTDALARLAVGETTAPAPWMGGWVVARCTDRTAARQPPFEDVAEQVLERYRRDLAEEAYGRYLDGVRAMANIRVLAGDE